MKAIVYKTHGSPDMLQYAEVEKPIPRDNEALIKVRAAGVNPLDCGELHGLPASARILFGLRKADATRPGRLGVDVSGEVEAVGRNVTRLKPGDAVFGLCVSDPQASGVKVWVHEQGAFAEYVCAHEIALATKPTNITFEQGAATPVAGLTALQGLRDHGHIQKGQKVLVNGASGGVGTFAVQIAASFGTAVTGVCSTRNVEMVRSIGAEHVIDYTREDFTELRQGYDLIFDCVGNHPLSACRRVMSPCGILVIAGQLGAAGAGVFIARLIAAPVLSRLAHQKFVTFLARPNQEDMATLHDLLKSGSVRPVVDSIFGFGNVPDAIRYMGEKHARGKVVVKVS